MRPLSARVPNAPLRHAARVLKGSPRSRIVLPVAFLAVTSCFEPAFTKEEAQEAVTSANIAASAEGLTNDVLTISTSFTLGQAVEQATEELRAFAASQVPCSQVSASANQVTIDFGGLKDACTYRGHTYAGVVVITVDGNTKDLLEVHHDWQGLTNGKVTLDGEADVTWSRADHSRHVTYMGTARFCSQAEQPISTNSECQGTLTIQGAVTQRLIDPEMGLRAGLEIDGTREWHTEPGREWKLSVDNVEVRGHDPVPQAGRYVLTTPSDKEVTMSFARTSATAVRVNVSGPRNRSFDIDVISLGY